MIQETANRRRGIRRQVRGEHAEAAIWLKGKRLPVLVINESVRGAAIVAVHVPNVSTGTLVRFESPVRKAECKIASLCYVQFADAVICRLGLEWTD